MGETLRGSKIVLPNVNRIQPPDAPNPPTAAHAPQVLRPRGAEKIDWASPVAVPFARRQKRVPSIDFGSVLLTGFYDAEPPKADENSAFSLRINQVGKHIVGYFSATA